MKKKLLDLSLFGLVDEFLVIGNDSLSDGLSDGVDLGDVTSTADGDTDVEVLESLEAQQQDGLHDFNSQ